MNKDDFKELNKQIGLRVKAFREAQHMTQADLAEKIGISSTYLCLLENGKKTNLTITTLHMIAEALNVKIDELLFVSDLEYGLDGDIDIYDVENIDETKEILIRNEKIHKAFYPSKYANFKVTSLMEFLLYLPLIDELQLYQTLNAIMGDFVGNEEYVCKKINCLIERIGDSPVKKFADMQYELLDKKRKEHKEHLHITSADEGYEYCEQYWELLRIKYETKQFEKICEMKYQEFGKGVEKCMRVE